jgi:predicted amino acid-binding ACT domain protein
VNVVKLDFHTEDDIGVLAGLSEALSVMNINLLETKLVTLEFSVHALLRVIADVSLSPLAKSPILDLERDLGAYLKRRGVRLYGHRPIIVQDVVGGPHTVPGHEEAFRLLTTLELELRSAIRSELSRLVPTNWWLDRIPPDVREKAQARVESPVFKQERDVDLMEDQLNYVDFASYVKILLRKNNWNDVFGKYFPSKEWLKSRLEELEPIRNSVAHGRKISPEDVVRLRMYAKDLLNKLHHEAEEAGLAWAGPTE